MPLWASVKPAGVPLVFLETLRDGLFIEGSSAKMELPLVLLSDPLRGLLNEASSPMRRGLFGTTCLDDADAEAPGLQQFLCDCQRRVSMAGSRGEVRTGASVAASITYRCRLPPAARGEARPAKAPGHLNVLGRTRK